MNILKSSGSELVFFRDINVQIGKVDEWLRRRDADLLNTVELYNLIDSGATLKKIIDGQKDKREKPSFRKIEEIARVYGHFHYSIQRECDMEIANFAKNNNALAVITNDTDFLIFDGDYKYWTFEDIRITQSNQLETTEYNRNGITKLLPIGRDQLPLFATLLGNDFTRDYFDQICDRFGGSMNRRMKKVADYVRQFHSAYLTESDIGQIIRQVLGRMNEDENLKAVTLFRQSLDSYDIDFSLVQIDDPLEQKLLNTKMYRPYLENTCAIQGIKIRHYETRVHGAVFPNILIDWIRRKRGILKQNIEETFTILAKKEEKYMEYEEIVICPEC